MELYALSVIYSDWKSTSSQNSVSELSFNAIYTLAKNSFSLIAYSASAKFAPMLVPLRNTCFDNMYSCFSLHKY